MASFDWQAPLDLLTQARELLEQAPPWTPDCGLWFYDFIDEPNVMAALTSVIEALAEDLRHER